VPSLLRSLFVSQDRLFAGSSSRAPQEPNEYRKGSQPEAEKPLGRCDLMICKPQYRSVQFCEVVGTSQCSIVLTCALSLASLAGLDSWKRKSVVSALGVGI
jgi:hypothetical protein